MLGRVQVRWIIALLGLLLALDSLLPWYRITWVVTEYGSGRQASRTNTASAWQASTPWSVSVALCLVTVVAFLFITERFPVSLGGKRWWNWLFPAASATAVAVVVFEWISIPVVNTTAQLQMTPPGGTDVQVGDIVRDQLYSRELNTAWGFFVGVLIMGVLTAVLVLRSARTA